MSAAVEARGLERCFGDVRALDGLSFELAPGELYGLVGPDGAGKTTAIRTLTGLIGPDAGSARVLGIDPLQGCGALRERMGLMPQAHSLYRDLTVAENLRFFGRLFCLSASRYRERTERLLSITRLGPFVQRRADALSGGMYKKLALACSLLHQPQVLFLDEPTNGVDPVSRRELWELVHELVADGMTVLLSTPYMDEAERCHRVGLVHRGRLIAEGEPQHLIDSLEHEAYAVRGGRDRAAVQREVEGHDAVIAASPAGARLRVMVAPGQGETLARVLEPFGARLEPTTPDFEDVFLVRTHEQPRAAEGTP